MSTQELKKEIQRVIDALPEDSLKEVLIYLQSYESIGDDQKSRMQHFRKIINEDANLLKRLAQ